MAEFDTNVQQTTGALNVPQPHAVEDNSAAQLISTLGNVGLNAGQDVQRGVILGTKAIGQGNVAEYSVQLGKIQQAVAQGSMSSTAARTRIRTLRSNVIANNPSMLPQIDTATSSFLSDSGLGSDIVKGTDTEQQQKATVKQMASEGWNIRPDMPQAQQDALINAWQQQKISLQQIQASAAQVALTRANLGVTSDKLGIEGKQQGLVTGAITQQTANLNLEDKLHQHNANQAVFTGAKAWSTNFQSKIDGIIQDFNNSPKSPADQQHATDQINFELAQITSNASKAGIGGDQSILDQAIGPMKDLAGAATAFVSGKVQTQGYTDAVNTAQNSATLLALHAMSPQSRATIGVLRAAPGLSSALSSKLADGVVLQVTGNLVADPNTAKAPDLAVGKDDPNYGSYSSTLDGVSTAIQKANLGTLDPNSQKLLNNTITNMANGLINGNVKAKTPQDYNRIVQFFADPAVNAYVVAHPNLKMLKGVSDVFNQAYVQPLKQVAQQEWTNNTVQQGLVPRDQQQMMSTPYGPVPIRENKEVPVQSVITPQFTGAGIRFVANDPNNTQAAAKADRLNQTLAPAISRVVKSTATLEGTSNYRKVWNETYAGWFGQPTIKEPDQPAQAAAAPAAAQTKTLTADDLIGSLIHTESNGNNSAVSSKGAISQVQILPSTAEALGYSTEDLKDPAVAKQAGKQYLGMMLDRFGDAKLALAAYNAGPGTVSKLIKKYGDDYAAIESHLPKETQDYVPKVLNGVSGG